MANCSIPNSIPANGRISIPSLARSRRQKPEDLSGKQESRKKDERLISLSSRDLLLSRAFFVRVFLNSPSCFPAFLRDSSSSRRVKGAWWPSRSSKSPSVLTGRGRFDSYPLRLENTTGKQESRKREGRREPLNLAPGEAKPPTRHRLSLRFYSCVPAKSEKFPAFSKGGDPACRASKSVN